MAGERILVVDDDVAVLKLCAQILVGYGYQVQRAERGQDALALLEVERFDLLLVDINMPDVGGLTILQRARIIDPGVVVVIITGYGTLENAIEALRAGARGFLRKPFDPEDLLAAVSDALEGRRLEQENLRLRARLPILEVSQALMLEANVERMAGRLLEIVVREIGADRASLMLLDEGTNELYVAGAIGLPDGIVDMEWARVSQDEVERTFPGEEPQVLDTDMSSHLHSSLQTLLTWPDVMAAVCLPLRTGKKAIGILNLCRLLGGRSFGRDDLDLLSIMGSQMAIALENARLYEVVARSKREWEATFDTITDGISIHDADFRIVRANRALAERLGTTAQALVGRTCYELFHNSQTPHEACPHISVMQNGQPQSIELEEPTLGGTFMLSSYPLRDWRGELTGSVHVLRDITEYKQMQASLVHTEKLAALGCLAASLAHEINNPLQALRSGLRLLINRPLEEQKRQRYLEVASREVERVITIVERVLNFYRPAAERP
ncbi:MAG: response regulator, partial [Chloroflexota bacterium]|nr:response regulator [Chloroflexota bacterium]